ncbi:hypothetical protein ACQPXT_01190 (plasmid) [Streptomyces sp. CA-100214]
MLTRQYGDGTKITYTYDNDGRTATMAADSTTTKYAYDAEANLTRTTLPNTLVEDRTYDTAARLTSVNATKAGPWLRKPRSPSPQQPAQPHRHHPGRVSDRRLRPDLRQGRTHRIRLRPQPQVSGCASSRTTSYTYDKAV